MLSIRITIKAFATAGAAAIATAIWTNHLTAQDTTQPYPTTLTAERAFAFARAIEQNLPYVPGEVLMKFRAGVSVQGQQRALRAMRSQPGPSDLRWITNDTALHRDSFEGNATILAAQLREQPEIEFAEPNYLHRLTSTPNDPGFARQWNLSAIDMPRAWDISPGGSASVIVAVVDSGVTTVNQSFSAFTWNGAAIQRITVPFRTNPDLATTRVVSPADFVTGTGPNPTVLDSQGHGSHVASTIGEDSNNNLAETGIAYNTQIMPVKVCASYWDVQFSGSASGLPGFAPPIYFDGLCPSDAVVSGIRYAADAGARVINLSLGGSQASSVEQDAVRYAVNRGAFVAIAAGNDYENGNPTEYPAAFANAIDGAMAVASVGPSLKRAFYSSVGPYVEIAAPGGSSREGGSSSQIWQGTICLADSDPATIIFPRFDRYCETALQGTSMATPHVSGIAALLISRGITKPAVIEALIRRTAKDLGTPGRDDEYGYGLIQPRAALFGFGIAR